jgi:hypothetical protein
MKFGLIILVIFLGACIGQSKKVNQYTSILQKADTLHIWFKFKDRISAVHKGDRKLFNWINEALSGKEENCSCDPGGGISVYTKDSLMLDIEFATPANAKDCEFLIIKEEGKREKCYWLNNSLGRYLDDMRDFIKPE